MTDVLSFWWGFGAGLLAGVAAACGGIVLAARWLGRHVPVTGPIDTALTSVHPPIEVGHLRVDPAASGWLSASDVTIDPLGPEIPMAPEVRRALAELPDGTLTISHGPPGTYDCEVYGHCRCWSEGRPCCDCGTPAGTTGKAYNDGR